MTSKLLAVEFSQVNSSNLRALKKEVVNFQRNTCQDHNYELMNSFQRIARQRDAQQKSAMR